MGKNPSKNININHTDRQIIFRSTGETELIAGEGVAVVSSGSKVNSNAQTHGTVPGTTINFQSPA